MKKRPHLWLALTLLLALWLGAADWGPDPATQAAAPVRGAWFKLLAQALGPAD